MSKFPLIENGHHSCTWDIAGTTLCGNVNLSPGSSLEAEAFDYPVEWHEIEGGGGGYYADLPQFAEHDVLRGRLRSNHDIALVRASTQTMIPEHTYIAADQAIVGLNLPQLPEFPRIAFQVGGLTELFGTHPVKEPSPEPDLTKEDAQFVMKWKRDAWSTVSAEPYELELNFELNASLFDPYQFNIATRPVVHVEGPTLGLDSWIKEFVEPFRGLAELATSRSQQDNWLEVHYAVPGHGDRPLTRGQVFSSMFNQKEYLAERSEPRRPLLFTVKDEGVSVNALLQGWKRLDLEYPTFLELYNSSVRDVLPLRSHFLVLMPALESLHSAKYGVQERDPHVHKAEVDTQYAKLKNTGRSNDDQRWFKRWTRSRTDYSLARRIRMLVELLPPELVKRIRDQVGGRKALNSEIDIMASARNDLAHGGTSWSNNDLVPYVRLATTIARGLVLQELEVPCTRLCRAMDRRHWRAFRD